MSVYECKNYNDLIAKIKSAIDARNREILAEKLTGSHFWTIQKQSDNNKFIYVYALQKVGKNLFSWTEFLEGNGLRFYTVPLEFLDRQDIYIRSHSWRENCKIFQKAKSRGGLRPWERRLLGLPTGD